jgi:hypothetical protein
MGSFKDNAIKNKENESVKQVNKFIKTATKKWMKDAHEI